VFSPSAGDYSSKQLDVFVLHDRHLFRKRWLDQAAECSSTSRREQPETSESTPKGDGFLSQISAGADRTGNGIGNDWRAIAGGLGVTGSQPISGSISLPDEDLTLVTRRRESAGGFSHWA
jgi:hypothetical protein